MLNIILELTDFFFNDSDVRKPRTIKTQIIEILLYSEFKKMPPTPPRKKNRECYDGLLWNKESVNHG